jgi:hypothetical protein
MGGMVGEHHRVEMARFVAAAEIARGDLPAHIAAVLEVIGRHRTLARIVIAARQLGPRFSASMAWAPSAPKLIAETFRREAE